MVRYSRKAADSESVAFAVLEREGAFYFIKTFLVVPSE